MLTGQNRRLHAILAGSVGDVYVHPVICQKIADGLGEWASTIELTCDFKTRFINKASVNVLHL